MKVSFRVKLVTSVLTILLYKNGITQAPNPYPPDLNLSHVKSWAAAAPESNPNQLMLRPITDVKQVTYFFDGQGRLLQTVNRQGSFASGQPATDMVLPVVYDAFGREQYEYMGYAANTTGGNTSITDGQFKLNPFQQQVVFYQSQYSNESHFYNKNEFEGSVGGRVQKSMNSGVNWVGSNRGIENKFWVNTTIDDVKPCGVSNSIPGILSTYTAAPAYPQGELHKNISIDEHGKQVIVFKDKNGNIILKKVQFGSTADNGSGTGYGGWICTYYIYDDKNRLRCTVQPKGVEALVANGWVFSSTILDEFCFRYEYDGSNRMVIKKLPGVGETYYVYDKKDRIVLTQDARLRNPSSKKWLYNVYDDLDRQVATGVIYDPVNYNNPIYHWTNASSSLSYPNLSSYSTEELTRNFYDDYSWRANFGNPLSSLYNNSYDIYLDPNGSVFPYAQPNNQSFQMQGFATGAKTRVLGTTVDLFSINIYDSRGRIIQRQSQNYTGGTDITTYQYAWNGKTVITVEKTEKGGVNSQVTVVITRVTLDDLGRAIKIEKKLSNTLVNGGNMSSFTTTSEFQYDGFGQLITKKLAPAYNGNTGLETQKFEYNIRGWLLGINKNYLRDAGTAGYESHFLGLDFAYDKTASIAGGSGNYWNARYNGQQTGQTWKTAGDGVRRKHDFAYDGVNRFGSSSFSQCTDPNSSLSFSNTEMNFSVHGFDADNGYLLKYDVNSNISGMVQQGYRFGNPVGYIDALRYTYLPNSNKLSWVNDDYAAYGSRLEDFQDGTNPYGTNDYSYDENGNMLLDKNKRIDWINYNYLNIPEGITIRDASNVTNTIIYKYDARGAKIQKEVYPNGVPPGIVTLYLNGTVFQDNVLQSISHEEGRIRFVKATTATCTPQPDKFVFDYFLKDNLGNIRMVLSDQQESYCYIPATVEDNRYIAEQAIYDIVDGRRIHISNTGAPALNFESKLYRVHGGLTSEKIGLGSVLKVMSGDEVRITAESFYSMPGGGPGPSNSIFLAELLNSFIGSSAVVNSNHSGLTTTGIANNNNNSVDIGNFLTGNNQGSNNARAFLCWILFDEHLNFVTGNADPVQANGGYKLHTAFINNPISIAKNGFLYIYVSNESNLPVYFDNLNITHMPGAMLEENHYYPFGQIMAGISSKAIAHSNARNDIRYNGKPFEQNEFSDGTGLGWYDYGMRQYDPQIGRFFTTDPLSSDYDILTPYQYASNDPVNNIDVDGMEGYSNTRQGAIAALWHSAGVSGTGGGGVIFDPNSDLGQTYSIENAPDLFMKSVVAMGQAGIMLDGIGFGPSNVQRAFFAQAAQQETAAASAAYRASVTNTQGAASLMKPAKDIAKMNWRAAMNKALVERRVVEAEISFKTGKTFTFQDFAMGSVGKPQNEIKEGLAKLLSQSSNLNAQRASNYLDPTYSARMGGLNLYKSGSVQATKDYGWLQGDRFLYLPSQGSGIGSAKLNWAQNYSRLRFEMRLGNPIFDSYRDNFGNLIPARTWNPDIGVFNGQFLNAERYTLQSRGWVYNPFTGSWIR